MLLSKYSNYHCSHAKNAKHKEGKNAKMNRAIVHTGPKQVIARMIGTKTTWNSDAKGLVIFVKPECKKDDWL